MYIPNYRYGCDTFSRPLGQGAFGEVYEGKLSSGRVNVMPAKVAVKVRYSSF